MSDNVHPEKHVSAVQVGFHGAPGARDSVVAMGAPVELLPRVSWQEGGGVPRHIRISDENYSFRIHPSITSIIMYF